MMGTHHLSQDLVLLPPLLWVEMFLCWLLGSRIRTELHTSLAVKFPFSHSLYVERFRCGIECDDCAVWASRKNKTLLSDKSLNVIHTVWLLREKEQHQKWGEPVLVNPREPYFNVRSPLFKGGLTMGRRKVKGFLLWLGETPDSNRDLIWIAAGEPHALLPCGILRLDTGKPQRQCRSCTKGLIWVLSSSSSQNLKLLGHKGESHQ